MICRGGKKLWQKLLAPVQPSSPRVWALGNGPAIRLISSDKDQVKGLVLKVRSLDQARWFLEERGLVGTDQADTVILGGPLLEGLNLTLVEQRSADE